MRAVVSWGAWITVVVLVSITTVVLFYPEPEPEPVVVVSELPVEEYIMQTPIEPEVPFYSERDLECLALNAYFESRNQSIAGQIAVSQVVMNRVESPRFPNTICDVINQGPTYVNWKGNEMPKRNQCHFSWWCDGKSDIPKDMNTYQKILDTVTNLVYSETIDITAGSTHYHADYVKPDWSLVFEKTVVIDDHIFYRH